MRTAAPPSVPAAEAAPAIPARRLPHRHARHRPRSLGDGHPVDEHRRLRCLSGLFEPGRYGMEGAATSCLGVQLIFDGKMRGLFSFLFGASTLLVIERAEASGQSPAKIHYMRMLWLLVFGLLHFYFIWFGDILSLYAMCGLILFFFRKFSVKGLLIWGTIFVLVQTLMMIGLSALAFYISDPRPAGRERGDRREWRECRRAAPLADSISSKLAPSRPWLGS